MVEKIGLFGAKELERALAQLPKSTAKGVLRRVAKKSLKPVQDAAVLLESATPRRTATESLADTLRITSALKPGQKRGRRADGVEMYMGSTAPDAHWKEFGTKNQSPLPFMRPAWELTQHKVLEIFASEIWTSIAKTARTLARKAEKGTLSKTAFKALK